MEEYDFITIPRAFNDLDLSAIEKIALSLVFGFDKNNNGVFYGSIKYIQEWLGCSKPTTISTMNKLIDKGLLIKGCMVVNNEPKRTYSINWTGLKNFTGVKKFDQVGKNSLPNNIDININNESIYKETKFDFRKALLSIGVTPEVVDAWMQVRKNKKATNSKIAFDNVVSEIRKSGLSADECIKESVIHSWSGFKAEWVQNQRPERRSFQSPRQTESFAEKQRRIARELFGETGKEVCDEQ